MTLDFSDLSESYLQLYPDCIPVKGAKRSAIYDLTRGDIFTFQSEYYNILQFLLTDKIGVLLESINTNEDRELIKKFICILQDNEFITFVDEASNIPKIEEFWETYSSIQNAIIDVDKKVHDFCEIFCQLDKLGCEYVQLRFFSDVVSLSELSHIISFSKDKSIESIEIIIKHNIDIPDNDYIKFVEDESIIVNFTIHSCPIDKVIKVDYGLDNTMKLVFRNITMLSKNIDSQYHCGIINLKNLNQPSTNLFFENKLYNGCLNGKISIDSKGNIKNCPSLLHSYGNIENMSLMEAVSNIGFNRPSRIVKDQIEVCKDCEFRYICSDCRAYLDDPKNIYSKPLKCGYDPYNAEWGNWWENTYKKNTIEYYSSMEV